MSANGHTTLVLPHGINKLSKTQMRELSQQVETGNVLLLSQFHPNAPWLVSRAMDRNQVVTGLAHIVIVAEADTKGGTWEGALGALKQGRRLYVREPEPSEVLPGNQQLLKKGATALLWSKKNPTQLAATLTPLLQESSQLRNIHTQSPPPADQLSLLAVRYE
jgi:DNA processing protein